MPKKFVFTIILKKFRMTSKPLKIPAKIIFINRKINLTIQPLKIIPYHHKKYKFNMCVIFAVQYILL